jgi:hypothetical protein
MSAIPGQGRASSAFDDAIRRTIRGKRDFAIFRRRQKLPDAARPRGLPPSTMKSPALVPSVVRIYAREWSIETDGRLSPHANESSVCYWEYGTLYRWTDRAGREHVEFRTPDMAPIEFVRV